MPISPTNGTSAFAGKALATSHGGIIIVWEEIPMYKSVYRTRITAPKMKFTRTTGFNLLTECKGTDFPNY
jgi:hypothetical protein